MIGTGSKRAIAVVVFIAALIVGSAAGAPSQGWQPRATGTADHAWFVSPIDVPSAPVRSGESVRVGQMHHVGVAAPLGSVETMRGHTIVEPPVVMTGFGDRLVFIYPPSEADGALQHPVRSLRSVSRSAPGGCPRFTFTRRTGIRRSRRWSLRGG